MDQARNINDAKTLWVKCWGMGKSGNLSGNVKCFSWLGKWRERNEEKQLKTETWGRYMPI